MQRVSNTDGGHELSEEQADEKLLELRKKYPNMQLKDLFKKVREQWDIKGFKSLKKDED